MWSNYLGRKGQTLFWKVLLPTFHFSLGCKNQHTWKSLAIERQDEIIKKAESLEQALIKVIRITEFLLLQHLAHTRSYESFVSFIGCKLKEMVLEEQLKFSKAHKSATYLHKLQYLNFYIFLLIGLDVRWNY